MKASRQLVFAPVILTLETQEEVDALYTVLNNEPVTSAPELNVLSRWWESVQLMASVESKRAHMSKGLQDRLKRYSEVHLARERANAPE